MAAIRPLQPEEQERHSSSIHGIRTSHAFDGDHRFLDKACVIPRTTSSIGRFRWRSSYTPTIAVISYGNAVDLDAITKNLERECG